MVRRRAPAQKALTPERVKFTADNENGDICEENNFKNELDEDSTSTLKSFDTIVESYNYLPPHTEYQKQLSEKGKKLWETVKEDYFIFSNWTTLLQTLEVEDNIDAARDAYNCFLRYYPYCYGYWKKFSDVEKKSGNYAQATEIFERGLKAIPVSVDLWIHYINFTMQQNKLNENQQLIRSLFDRALDSAGMEFRSNKLWDTYITWEKALGNLKRVTEIFDRLIATPTQQHLRNWQRFKEHLQSNSLAEVLPIEEYNKIMQEMDAVPPGMGIEDIAPSIVLEKLGKDVDEKNNDLPVESAAMKKKVISEREFIYSKTACEVTKRLEYEEAIKRPYFHVKPLEVTQISNWNKYLDYEIQEGEKKRILFLFERCLVACAMYEDFWHKYIDFAEKYDPVLTYKIFYRACNIHLIKHYKIHLRWSIFEEKQNRYDSAALVLKKLDTNFPGLIFITQRRAGLARRMKKYDDVVSVYENAISRAEKIEEKIFYSIKFSRFLGKVANNKEKARSVLWKALQLGKNHKRLYLQLMDLEMYCGTVEINHVTHLFEAVDNDLNIGLTFQEMFQQRIVEFLQEFCDDINVIVQVEENYKLTKIKRESLKRSNQNSISTDASSKVLKSDIPLPSEEPKVIEKYPTFSDRNNSWFDSTGEGNNYSNWSDYPHQFIHQQQHQQHYK
ncbi:pre-mRNA-processing factor 39 isoform X2 [Hydra vulgaris]|uniref:Pre-mRNA-processing factor 39 isoform X2 n=1 Tax=Hydra vulgaris TaxID=6087 RepID=A0ABM4CIX8_HYDVU